MKRAWSGFTGLDFGLLKRFGPYLRRYLVLAVTAFVLMVVTNVIGILQPYFIKVGIDQNVANRDWPGLVHTVTILGIVLAAGFLFQFFYNFSVQFLGQRLLYDLRMDLFKKILYLSNAYFDRTPVGKTLTNLTNDVEAVRQCSSEGVVTVMGELLKVVLIFTAMMWVNFRLTLAAFVIIPFFLVATVIIRKSIRSGFRDVRKANSQINTAWWNLSPV